MRLALARTALAGTAVPLLLLLGLVGASATVVSGDGTADDDPQALEALSRAARASAELAYQGTQMVSVWTAQGSATRILDIRQQAGGRRWVSIQEPGRSGLATTVNPGQPAASPDPQYAQVLSLLAAGYRLAVSGPGRVAGRRALVVVASRDGQERARIWLDASTDLPLRHEVLDASGRLRRAASFIDIVIDSAPGTGTEPASGTATGSGTASGTQTAQGVAGRSVAGTASPPAVADPAPAVPDPGPAAGVVLPPAWPRAVSAQELGRLRAAGWTCPQQLPDGLQLVDARFGPGAGESATLHLTYTDGLSAVSVFVQHGRLDAAGLSGFAPVRWDGRTVYLAAGWPARVVWQGGREVITVVGDSTPDEVRGVVAQLSRGVPDDGPMARIVLRLRGALSWLHLG